MHYYIIENSGMSQRQAPEILEIVEPPSVTVISGPPLQRLNDLMEPVTLPS